MCYLEVTVRPSGVAEPLASVVKRNGLRYYSGRDESVIQTYASEESPLVVLSRRAPRRDCELGYLKTQGITEVDLSPRLLKSSQLPAWVSRMRLSRLGWLGYWKRTTFFL